MMKETIKSIFFIIIVLAIILIPKITNAVITADEMVNDYISIKKDDDTPFSYIKDDQYLLKDKDDNGNIVLHLAEKNEISDDSYATIINSIDIIFGNNTTSYFKAMCPNFNKSTNIDGFNVEINPERTRIEKGIFNNENYYQYKCLIRITIDTTKLNDAVNKYMSKDNNTATNNTKETNVVASNITSMPRTGEEQDSDLFIAYTLIVLSIIGIITLIITRKK